MNKKLFIANWKMELTPAKAVILAKDIKKQISSIKKITNLEFIICASFTDLKDLHKVLTKSNIKLGAQDVAWQDYGAYTGGINSQSLKEIGCDYVIIGHSERRKYNNESDQIINQKIKAALNAKLIPILCVGETLEERRNNQKEATITKQVEIALANTWLNKEDRLIIAYEPVWVIGTGEAVPAEDAERMQAFIKRNLLEYLPPDRVNNNISIVYGGSINHLNIKSFYKQPSIDGFLIGGASLSVDSFMPIIKNIL